MQSHSRTRSSSPFSFRKPASSYSSYSCSTSPNARPPRSGSASSILHMNSGNDGSGSVSTATSRSCQDVAYYGGQRSRTPVPFVAEELVTAESIDGQGNADSISVTVRFRPLSDREFRRGDDRAWYADGNKIVRNEYCPATAYAFDRVFGENTTTQEVYEVSAKSVVKASMEGVNGTVFAYGVTSSGKTFTMHGDQNCPGIIPLAIKDVFSIIQESPGREFLLRVSYIEIYNEVINDLLDPTGQNLRIREDAQGTYVEGIKEEVLLSPGHALSFIAAGEEHRHVGSNNFNLFSSRSHTIFSLMIESSARDDEYDGAILSQLNLIDLAGSESSKTETTGLRRKEGSYINKSLLTLGTVIGKLSEGKTSHVPYRDSKLTRLLQSSLTGHGHVSLICTVTPASSNFEETHNTLKFASRAKRVEILASRNKIIDEKSLIKKYQREISTLKEELDHLKKGMLDVSHEEILTLRQKLEEGQVKMQSRLEKEEEAKAALMSRIQRLTKLILVSTKNSIPLTEVEIHKENLPNSTIDVSNSSINFSHGANDATSILESKSFDNCLSFTSISSDAQSTSNNEAMSTRAEPTPAIDSLHMPSPGMSKDQEDLIVEQVEMLAGEVALATSTLKRLVEQPVDDTQNSKEQIKDLEREIHEKKKQMRVLEERLLESRETSTSKPSLDEMQQTVTKLMAQCNEKSFELEIKCADNRVLQEQLQNKFIENHELREKLKILEKKMAGNEVTTAKVLQNERIRKQLREENNELRVRNQKVVQEASYAKELASAAAVELKNLASEITRLSLQNSKLENELLALRKTGRTGKLSGRNTDGELEGWDMDPHDMKIELLARRQREAALESALAEKESVVDEYRRKADEAKKREEVLESDLANMWIIVAQLKKAGRDNANPVIEYRLLGHEVDVPNANCNSHVCKVCFESPTSAILLPCRHFCLCKSCSLACSECPICRTNIVDRLFAFAS